jgi:AraC-like DNA-binding protein
MRKKKEHIPIKLITRERDSGIVVGRVPADALQNLATETEFSHRHDCHFFALHERGEIEMEIDFERYKTDRPSLLYMNPDQVHRTLRAEPGVLDYVLAISSENINPEYLKLLEDITPARPLLLSGAHFAVIRQVMLLCVDFFESDRHRLYQPLLKDSCNTLIALMISQYQGSLVAPDNISRADSITKAFRAKLDRDFITRKRPADYAEGLNISVAYLNECVRSATGLSVTHHIQQRVILEAKRLLYHSDNSVKEIATALVYDDYPYFSRLFTKVTGMTALAFRSRNHD